MDFEEWWEKWSHEDVWDYEDIMKIAFEAGYEAGYENACIDQ